MPPRFTAAQVRAALIGPRTPNFSRRSLAGVDLSHCDLSGIDLAGADLRGAPSWSAPKFVSVSMEGAHHPPNEWLWDKLFYQVPPGVHGVSTCSRVLQAYRCSMLLLRNIVARVRGAQQPSLSASWCC
jgi:hypothetical protein